MLRWTSTDDTVTEFEIARSEDGGAFKVIATVGPNCSFYVDPYVTAGQQYTYEVMAVNDQGVSDPSATATVTPMANEYGSWWRWWHHFSYPAFSGARLVSKPTKSIASTSSASTSTATPSVVTNVSSVLPSSSDTSLNSASPLKKDPTQSSNS